MFMCHHVFNLWFKRFILILPIVFAACVVLKYGVNIPIWDDFRPLYHLIDIKQTGKIDFSDLFSLHNEHRIFFAEILILIIASLTHFNTKVIMLVSVFLLAMTYLVFVFVSLHKKTKDFDFLDVVCAFMIGMCLFGLIQYENLLWSFQLAWFLIEFCTVLGLSCFGLYIQTKHKKYLCLALFSAFISSFCSLHGLALWFCYFGVLFIYDLSEKKINKNVWGCLILCAVLSCVLYFNGYHAVPHHQSAKSFSFWSAFEFFMKNIGGALTGNENDVLAFTVGIFESLLSLILIALLLIKKQIKENVLPIGVIVFGMGFAFLVAVGRSGWQGMPSRYMTFSLLAVAGNMVLLSKFIRSDSYQSMIAAVIFLLLGEFIVYSDISSFKFYNMLYTQRIELIEKLKNYEKETAESVYNIDPLFKNDEDMRRSFRKVEEANLSVFYERKGR